MQSGPEKAIGIVKDVVLPIDVRTRYDVYFTDRRVAIVCMGRAERFESETEETLSYMPSAFGVPAPIPAHWNEQPKPTIDEETAGMSLDDLLKLSKKSCFYALEEIERVELVWGHKPKFLIMSRDCESKFAPDEEQLNQLVEVIPKVEGLKNKLWIAGKWTALFDESLLAPACKFCGSVNDEDAVHCQTCGKKLGEEPAIAEPAEVTCGNCGKKNSAQALYCKQCGTPIRLIRS